MIVICAEAPKVKEIVEKLGLKVIDIVENDTAAPTVLEVHFDGELKIGDLDSLSKALKKAYNSRFLRIAVKRSKVVGDQPVLTVELRNLRKL